MQIRSNDKKRRLMAKKKILPDFDKKPIKTKTSYSFWEKIIPPFILSILATGFYCPSLNYPFQFDDIAHITKKFNIRVYTSWSWRQVFSPRWFGDWLNKINYQIGGFDPFSYRCFNLAIHILAGITLFFLIFLICSKIKKFQFFPQNAPLISFITAALFLLHPVQSQLVSYVIQARLEGLATLFTFSSLLLFVLIAQTRNIILKIAFSILLVVIGFISCSTKETVIISPLLAIALDWFLLAEQSWDSLKKRIWLHALFFCTIFGSFLYFQKLQWFTKIAGLKMSVANNRGNILTQKASDLITPYQYMISEFKVILHYMLIFIWPFNISVEYDWKLSAGFFAPDAFFPFLALATIGIFVIRNTIKKQYAFLTFGLTWFFISVAPRSSIIPSAELICDYKTYTASMGLFFIFSFLITNLINAISKQFQKMKNFSSLDTVVLSITSLLVVCHFITAGIVVWQAPYNLQSFASMLFIIPAAIVYLLYYLIKNKTSPGIYTQINKVLFLIIFLLPIGFGALIRNKVWSSDESFWSDVVVKAPLKARAHNNLGVAKAERQKWNESIACYKEAIRLDTNYCDPWSNLAVAYSSKNQVDMAIMALKNAIRLNPHYPEAYNNLGSFLLQKKDYVGAERCYHIALQLRPYYGKAFMNLGRLYLEKNEKEKSYEHFVKATQGDLDNAIGFRILGEACVKLEKHKEASAAFEKSIAKGANDLQIYFNLANSYFMVEEFDKAQQIYEKLASNDPNNAYYFYNLGETLFRKGDFARALQIFIQSKSMPNALAQTHFRIVNCLEVLGRVDEAKEHLQALLGSSSPEWFKNTAQNELKRLELVSQKSFPNQKLA